MTDSKTLDLLKKAFRLEELKQANYIEGLFSGKGIKYFIPGENFKETLKEFPFIKNAVAAGLFAKDMKGNYQITDATLSARSTHSRKKSKKQFFSISGEDENERTTIYDLLVTIGNLRYISKKFGVSSEHIKFTIRHQNGDPNNVVNYVELDKKLFGDTEEVANENISQLNKLVKYEREKFNTEAASA